jgi:MoaA/NifB/PqqE/SkfB family radical SAM enzyme
VGGIPGHFAATVQAIRALADAGLTVQVNTTVLAANAAELADMAELTVSSGARIREVFFLVQVGRGTAEGAVTPAEHEEICTFCTKPRTMASSCAPSRLRSSGGSWPGGDSEIGRPTGKGILFVSHDGEVYPAGFLALGLGNVRSQPLSTIYREDPLLRAIREARFGGRCEYADLCGGSGARAYAASGDPLGEDQACGYQPGQTAAGVWTPIRARDVMSRSWVGRWLACR